jgi:hypothetical protein
MRRPTSVLTEYQSHRNGLLLANNDPRAGMAQLLELIHVEPGRVEPDWSQVPPELAGAAPRVFAFELCRHMVEQLQSASVKKDGTARQRPPRGTGR